MYNDEEVSVIFSKTSRFKLLYFFLAIMLLLHSFQGFQGGRYKSSDDKLYSIPYSELDIFFIDSAQKINYGTSTAISLEIIGQFSDIEYFFSLFQWQTIMKNHVPCGTSIFLIINGEILGGTSYSLLILIGTIYLEKPKYQETKGNKNRSIIKATISENPGINLREIQRSTNLAMGVIQYHIHSLESGEQEIESLKFGRCKHFFLSNTQFTTQEKLWFSLSQNPSIKSILDLLVFSDGQFSQKDLSLFTGKSKSLISYYIKVLRNNGVIEVENHQLRISEEFFSKDGFSFSPE